MSVAKVRLDWNVMSTVQEIKSAIAKLSLEEQAELISELWG